MFVSASVVSGLFFFFFSAAIVGTSEGAECVKGIASPAGANTSEWPELYRLNTSNPEDPTALNMDESAGLVDPTVLMAAGVQFHFLDPTGYDYPNGTKAIPWAPPANGTNDMNLQEIRDANDYKYADIVVVTGYHSKFYEEHIHAGGDEVRYIIDGSGYFDIRDVNDEWVRMHAEAGDFVVFPSGIEHRFAVDDKNYVQAMRLYPGSGTPDWSSTPRSEVKGNNTSRNEYVDKYLCGIDPDMDHDHGQAVSASGSPDNMFSSSIIIFAAAIGLVVF